MSKKLIKIFKNIFFILIMPITIPNYQTDNINKKEKYRKSFNNFLDEKKVTSGSVATHTSWGWKNGKYYIDAKEYKKLLKKYASVVKYGLPGDQPISLTEKPKDISPVYVDIDFSKDSLDHVLKCIKFLYDEKEIDINDVILVTSVGYPKSGRRMNVIQTHYIKDLKELFNW